MLSIKKIYYAVKKYTEDCFDAQPFLLFIHVEVPSAPFTTVDF